MNSKFEELRIYQTSEEISDRVWEIVLGWDYFARDTVGKQLVRSTDSVSANIAEGAGKGSDKDNAKYIKIARGSLFEAKHWLKKAKRRNLLSEEQFSELSFKVEKLLPSVSTYLNYLKGKISKKTSKSTSLN